MIGISGRTEGAFPAEGTAWAKLESTRQSDWSPACAGERHG